MRQSWVWMLFVITLGCGGGGGGMDAAQCADLSAQFDALVEDPANRTCSLDADCTWIANACFDSSFCDTFVNVAARDQANALVNAAKTACRCVECMAQRPACNNGVCGGQKM